MTVHLDVWTVGTSAIGKALWHMAADPLLLRRVPGLEFHKSLGTGAGRRFTAADADLRQWALVTCWSAEPSEVPVLDKWHRLARSHTRFTLGTIASHGQWSGRNPFVPDPSLKKWPGTVAAITRARVRLAHWRGSRPRCHRWPQPWPTKQVCCTGSGSVRRPSACKAPSACGVTRRRSGTSRIGCRCTAP